MVTVIKGNEREVPPDIPVMVWWEKVEEYAAIGELLVELPWHHASLEYLSPAAIARVRAKALVWREVTGEWPTEIAWWWEVRMARRAGDHPHGEERALSWVDEDGTLHCGKCGACWSANRDGSPQVDRCKLCDVIFVFEDVELWPDWKRKIITK